MTVEKVILAGRQSYHSIRRYLERKKEARAAVLGLLVLVLGIAISKLFESSLLEVATIWSLPEWEIHLSILFLSLLSILLYLCVKRKEIFRPPRGLPNPSAGEKLSMVPISNLGLLKILQEQVVPEIFGTATPPDEMVYESFERNPCRSIGLYSEDE